MQETALSALENLFLALSDKTRMRLLGLMASGEVSVGFLAEELGESQPKISRHLAYLRNAGLVSTRRDGKWIYYGLEPQDEPAVSRVLNASLTAVTGRPVLNGSSPPDGIPRTSGQITEIGSQTWVPDELPIYLL